MKPIIKWVNQEELNNVYSSQYWNNINEERKKEWWVLGDNDDSKLLEYLNKSNLLRQFLEVEKFLTKSGNNLIVCDLAAGTGWATALLSKLPNVKEVHAVEISEHGIR